MRWRRIRLSREPPIEGRRVGWACASSRLPTRPSTFHNLSNHSVSRRVSATSALLSIGQENFVCATGTAVRHAMRLLCCFCVLGDSVTVSEDVSTSALPVFVLVERATTLSQSENPIRYIQPSFFGKCPIGLPLISTCVRLLMSCHRTPFRPTSPCLSQLGTS